MIYLDHAGTTPVPRPVADAMYEVLTNQFGNPSSQYPLGREAKQLVEGCRATVAGALGCRPENLHFTSCGTESDNWAISAAVWQGRHAGRHIITTAVEHSAVLEPCRWLQQQGYEVTYLAPDKTGQVTVQQVADALREDTVLVSMMLVNNETGCVFPVEETARLLREKKSRALLHCDAVQGFLKVPCDPAGWGVDLMSLSAHKIGGPKGVGALYTAPELRNLRPLLPGGGQEGGLRSGTEATAQIAGLPGPWSCGRSTWMKRCGIWQTSRPIAGSGCCPSPGWFRWAKGPRPTSWRFPWWGIPAPTSSRTWVRRASASPPGPPATGARPAMWCRPCTWTKRPPQGSSGSASVRTPPERTSTGCIRPF